MSNENGNRGVIVSGGTLKANEMAVGDNPTINKISQIGGESVPTMQELRNELNLLISEMEKYQIGSDKIAAAKTVKGELEKDSPNMLVVKPVLHSIIDSIKMIGTVAGTALSVKKILDLLVF